MKDAVRVLLCFGAGLLPLACTSSGGQANPGDDGGSVDTDARGSVSHDGAIEGAAGDGGTSDGTAGDGTAGDGGTSDGTAGDGTAGDGTAGDGGASDGTAGDGTAGDDAAPDGAAADAPNGDLADADGSVAALDGSDSGGEGGPNCPAGAASPTATGTDNVTFLSGVTVDTLAGGANPGTSDGLGQDASFSNPVSIARIDASDFVVADYDSSRLRLVTSIGTVTTMPTATGFTQPYGLAEAAGTLFVQTDQDSTGAKSLATGTIWSVASGQPPSVFIQDVGRPRALVRWSATTLALADFRHHTVEVLDRGTMTLTVLAGTTDCYGFADGPGNAALFNAPAGIVVRSDGSLVVSDPGNRKIRLVSSAGVVSTLAGDGVAATVDGPANATRFVYPRALAIDANDNIYVSDDGAHRIRRIDSSGNVVTVAGAGSTTNGYQDGNGSIALFAGQEGIALSADGKTLYVADGNGGSEVTAQMPFHRIRRLMLP
jgi:hypothetical protein